VSPFTIADLLPRIEPHMSRALVLPEMWPSLRPLAALLPAGAVSSFGFECHLGTPAPRTDFGAGAYARACRAVWAGEHPSACFPDALRRHPSWARIEAFARAWNDPRTEISERIDQLWVEIDVDGPPPDVPIPGVFVSFRKDGDEGPATRTAWALDAVERFSGTPAAPAIGEGLTRCFAAVPAGARVVFVGLLLSRPEAGVRLNIEGLSPAAVAAYLRTVGYPADVAQIERVAADLATWADRLVLTIDVGAALSPRVGFECFVSREQPWRRSIAALVDRGHCTAAAGDALQDWPGHEAFQWPAEIGRYVLSRGISHIKVAFWPGPAARVEAKAYLQVTCKPLRHDPFTGWRAPRVSPLHVS
jgi:hypothetical protein